MRTTFDRLHYATAGSTVPAASILAAVLVREHLSSGGLEAIAAVGLLLLSSPLVALMTARAVHDVDGDS
jgi:multisubunit Na+/H+ antiporter MnhG subunit